MATIYYCKICDILLVDEDELPTVGVYCSKKCEKLAEKFGVVEGRKEYKRREKEERRPSSSADVSSTAEHKELPAELPPPIPRRKKPTITDGDSNSTPRNKILSLFGGKRGDNSNSENESSSDDSKKNKNRKHTSDSSNDRSLSDMFSNDRSKDYEDSLEYFRKRSEITNNIRRDRDTNDNNNSNRKPRERRPNSMATNSNNSSINTNTQPHVVIIPVTTTPTITPNVENPPNPNQQNLNDIILDQALPSEPPPSYETLFPNSSPLKKDKNKSDSPLPDKLPELPERKTRKNVNKITENKKDNGHNTIPTNKPVVPPKISLAIPPQVPPKIPISARNIQRTPPRNQQLFNDDSNQFSNYQQNSGQFIPTHQQPHNNTPADTFLQEQATLPPTVYPPPFYTIRRK